MHACATSQSWQSVLNLMTFMQTLGLDEISKLWPTEGLFMIHVSYFPCCKEFASLCSAVPASKASRMTLVRQNCVTLHAPEPHQLFISSIISSRFT